MFGEKSESLLEATQQRMARLDADILELNQSARVFDVVIGGLKGIVKNVYSRAEDLLTPEADLPILQATRQLQQERMKAYKQWH